MIAAVFSYNQQNQDTDSNDDIDNYAAVKKEVEKFLRKFSWFRLRSTGINFVD